MKRTPLARKPAKRKARKPIKARNPKRRASEFIRCYGSKARVEAIKALACWACQNEMAENAHTQNGGTGRKAGWETIVDLGRNCHRRLHALGSVELFDAEFGTDLRARAAFLAEFLDPSRLESGSRASTETPTDLSLIGGC